MSEVLEYLFFTRAIADQFAAALDEQGLPYQEEIEAVQAAIVFKIPEEAAANSWDALDDLYDELAIADQALLEASVDDELAGSAAGIYL